MLETAFSNIHARQASTGDLSFEILYRRIYKLVLNGQAEALYTHVADFEKRWLSTDIRTKVAESIAPELHAIYTNTASHNIQQRKDLEEKFLKTMREVYFQHDTSLRLIGDIMLYLDRVYSLDQHKATVYESAMAIFRNEVLYASSIRIDEESKTFLQLLVDVMLHQVKIEREGDTIDKQLLRANTTMLEYIFTTVEQADSDRLYLQMFEHQFLEDSRLFYKKESESMLRSSDAGSYCRHVKKRIAQEQDRCRSTLSSLTTSKITLVVEEELIVNKLDAVINSDTGLAFMVANDKISDIRHVFDLSARIDIKKIDLARALQKIIGDLGGNINENVTSIANPSVAQPAVAQQQDAPTEDVDEKAKPGPDKAINVQTAAALQWVENILSLKDKFDMIWSHSFASDQVLQTVLTKSFGDIINAFPRCSEYISLFIDDNMKKGIKGKTEQEVDQVLEKAIVLLRYVQDKDIFESYYKKHLCRRLIMGKSLSLDVERSMIGRMKVELGNSFTLKLEAMFKDMSLSEELTSDYKNYMAGVIVTDTKRVELAIHVLTSMTWPLESIRNLDDDRDARLKTIYPTEIEMVKASFEKFYAKRHSGRVLSWQANMGTADIKSTFPKVPSKDGPPRPRVHELNVSTFAMIILSLFNDIPASATLSFEQIQTKTNIPTSELIRNLQSLAVAPKTRVLLKEPMSKDVKPDDRFRFNEGFNSKFIKIKVGVVSAGNRVENDRERRETEKRNNDSRGFVIEAAIVRIMKQRQIMGHTQLITETLAQLSGQFRPDVAMTKKKIESLIEREYLERDDDAAMPTYKYLA